MASQFPSKSVAELEEMLGKANEAVHFYQLNDAVLKQKKTNATENKNKISEQKKTRLKYLQEQINKAKVKGQKDSKRKSKEREAKTFDAQIKGADKIVRNVQNEIKDNNKLIAQYKLIRVKIQNELKERAKTK